MKQLVLHWWLQTCKKKPLKNFGDAIKLEISWKFADAVGSKPSYFRSGVKEACLNFDGK